MSARSASELREGLMCGKVAPSSLLLLSTHAERQVPSKGRRSGQSTTPRAWQQTLDCSVAACAAEHKRRNIHTVPALCSWSWESRSCTRFSSGGSFTAAARSRTLGTAAAAAAAISIIITTITIINALRSRTTCLHNIQRSCTSAAHSNILLNLRGAWCIQHTHSLTS